MASVGKTYRAWWGPPVLAGGAYEDGSVLANRLGLQLARIATLNAAWLARKRPVDPDLRAHVEAYERDGVVMVENFLDPGVFAQIQTECRAAHAAGLFRSEVVEDNQVIEETLSVKKNKDRLPVTWSTISGHEWLARMACAVLRRPEIPKLQLDVNFFRKSKDAPPPSRLVGTNYLHADVHYPSGKAWLYLNDIDEANGAIVYAKGSHKLGLGRLYYEYDASVRVAKAKRNGSGYKTTVPADVVRLPTPRQMRAMNIVEEPMCAPANTLVFVNVMGFHRRGEFEEGARREQLHIRFNDRPAPRRR